MLLYKRGKMFYIVEEYITGRNGDEQQQAGRESLFI